MNVLQGISISLSPSSSQQECSAHDLTCIRDSWTPRTFRQQVTETALPLYLHCCRLPRFYILTGSRSELQQRPLLLSPFASVHFSALGRGTIFPRGGQLSLMCHNRFLPPRRPSHSEAPRRHGSRNPKRATFALELLLRWFKVSRLGPLCTPFISNMP